MRKEFLNSDLPNNEAKKDSSDFNAGICIN